MQTTSANVTSTASVKENAASGSVSKKKDVKKKK
jgi:hypothetical protein